MSKEVSTRLEKGAISQAIEAMSEATREIYESGLKRRMNMARDSVLEKYDMGTDFDKVMGDGRKYGENAAKLLATAWDVNDSDVYSFRSIAVAWDRRELEKILNRKTSQGSTIKITHLISLASITRQTLRDSLINRVFTESLSSRELAAIIQQKLGARGNNTKGRGVVAPRSPMAGLAKLCKLSQAVLLSQEGIESAVFEKLDQSLSEYVDDTLVVQLTAADKILTSLYEIVDKDRRRVSSLLDTASKMQQASQKDKKKKGPAAKAATVKPKAAQKKPITDATDDDEPQEEVQVPSNGHKAAAKAPPAKVNLKAKAAAAAAKAKKKRKLQVV